MEPQSTLQDIDPVTRHAKVSIPSEKLHIEVTSAVKKYSTKAKVKGFRAGKAPVQMIEQMYGESIRWDVVSKLISETLQDVVTKNNLQMVGTPKIDITANEPGKDLEFTADFSIYPTPTITGYEGVEVEIEKAEVTDEDVTKVVDSYRRAKATVTDVTDRDTVLADDVIDVTVTFKADDGSTTAPESATIGLGDGRLPKEFDDQVVGMKVGDSREVKLASGEKGELVYTVHLNKISSRVLPDFTDEFVATLGIDEKTAQEVKDNIRKKLVEENDRGANERSRQVIVDKLIELNDFPVPQPLIDDEIRQMLIRVGAVDPKKTEFEKIPAEPFRDNFGDMAKKRVKATVIVDQVAQAEKITPNDEDMNKAFLEVAAQYRVSEAEARKMFSGRAMINLAVEVAREKAQDFLVSKAKIKYISKKN